MPQSFSQGYKKGVSRAAVLSEDLNVARSSKLILICVAELSSSWCIGLRATFLDDYWSEASLWSCVRQLMIWKLAPSELVREQEWEWVQERESKTKVMVFWLPDLRGEILLHLSYTMHYKWVTRSTHIQREGVTQRHECQEAGTFRGHFRVWLPHL